MSSIKSKLVLSVCVPVVLAAVLSAVTGAYCLVKVTENSSVQLTKVLATERAGMIDLKLEMIENSLSDLEKYFQDNFDNRRLGSISYMADFIEETEGYISSSADLDDSVLYLYFVPDPKEYGTASRLFMKRNAGRGFVNADPVKESKAGADDAYNTEWYQKTISEKKAIWTRPYFNSGMDAANASYAVPVYIEKELLGILGADINMQDILDTAWRVSSVPETENIEALYEGLDFLADSSGNIIYSKEPANVSDSEFFSSELRNGMTYGIFVPDNPPDYSDMPVWLLILASIIVITAAVFIALRLLTKSIVQPVQNIHSALKRMSEGDMNVDVVYKPKNEIGSIAEIICSVANNLNEYIPYIHSQAYSDAMTGVGNKAAYMELISQMNSRIDEDKVDFAVAVFDVNGLKRVNDKSGHEYGDMLIIDAAKALMGVFGAENVYRIGGDEFIVVMDNKDSSEMEELLGRFDHDVEELNKCENEYGIPLSVSKGYAVYTEPSDKEYMDVFRRADEEMYEDKAKYYNIPSGRIKDMWKI